MKAQFSYKLLGFLITDYKVYEMYLEALALEGYELVGIKGTVLGKFMQIEPRPIKYYVDLVKIEERDDYVELCEASGWELVAEIREIKIFKVRQEIEPLPIHTDKEIEGKHIIDILMKRDGWQIIFALPWFMLGIAQFKMMSYRTLLRDILILDPIMKFALAMIYAIRGTYALHYIWKMKRKLKNNKEIKRSIRGAKARRNFNYLSFVLIWLIIFGGLGSISWQSAFVMVLFIAFVVIFIITVEKYRAPLVGRKKKCIYTLLTTIMFLIIVYIGTPMLLNDTTEEVDEIGTIQEQVDQLDVLSLRDFPIFKEAVVEDCWLDKGSSIVLEAYYEYTEFLVRDGDLRANYYRGRNEQLTDLFWRVLLSGYRDTQKTYRLLEKVASQPFDVDEAYYSKNYRILFLRKGNEILLIDSRGLDVWEAENAEVIKNVFK